MTTVTAGNDVFEMAIGMERIGKDFYEALALGCDDAKVREFCLKAAKDEGRHLATFEQLRKQWAADNRAGAAKSDAPDALAALAKEHIQPDPKVVHKVAMGGKVRDAIQMAIEMERDSIQFYKGIQAGAPDLAKVVDAIVQEEMRHLANLSAFGN